MSNENSATLTGRLVFVIGDLFAGETAKIYGTQTPKLNKQGQQYKEYGFGLAVPKDKFQDPSWDAGSFWQKLHTFVASKYNGNIPPNFKIKYIDGDTGVNQDGSKVNLKQGYPGHVIFTFKSTITPKFYKSETITNPEGKPEKVYIQIAEGIKCGYWVRVQASFDINTGANASVYINPRLVELLAVDAEIVNAPSAAKVFGGLAAPVLPIQSPATAPAHQYHAPAHQYHAPHHGVLPAPFQPQTQGLPNFAPSVAPQSSQAAMPMGSTAPSAYPSNSGGMPPLPFSR